MLSRRWSLYNMVSSVDLLKAYPFLVEQSVGHWCRSLPVSSPGWMTILQHWLAQQGSFYLLLGLEASWKCVWQWNLFSPDVGELFCSPQCIAICSTGTSPSGLSTVSVSHLTVDTWDCLRSNLVTWMWWPDHSDETNKVVFIWLWKLIEIQSPLRYMAGTGRDILPLAADALIIFELPT